MAGVFDCFGAIRGISCGHQRAIVALGNRPVAHSREVAWGAPATYNAEIELIFHFSYQYSIYCDCYSHFIKLFLIMVFKYFFYD